MRGGGTHFFARLLLADGRLLGWKNHRISSESFFLLFCHIIRYTPIYGHRVKRTSFYENVSFGGDNIAPSGEEPLRNITGCPYLSNTSWDVQP